MTTGCVPAVVFDLDGTLADTATDVQRALNRALASDDLPPIDTSTVRLMIGGGPRLLVSRALQKLGVDKGQYLIDRLTDVFYDEYLRQEDVESRLFEGAKTCLDQLKSAGTRIGLCSNKPDELCRKLVAELGVASYFDVIQGRCHPGIRHGAPQKAGSGAIAQDHRASRHIACRHTLHWR
jgi:phosphoglycolate phosphatase